MGLRPSAKALVFEPLLFLPLPSLLTTFCFVERCATNWCLEDLVNACLSVEYPFIGVTFLVAPRSFSPFLLPQSLVREGEVKMILSHLLASP